MKDLAKWRRKLFERVREFVRVIEGLDMNRPQIRGSIYHHRIRCGYPKCHCAEGPGHPRWCLSFESRKGRHTWVLSEKDLRDVQPKAEAYRKYRWGRARAAKLVREIFEVIDRIQRGLQRSVPARRWARKGKGRKRS